MESLHVVPLHPAQHRKLKIIDRFPGPLLCRPAHQLGFVISFHAFDEGIVVTIANGPDLSRWTEDDLATIAHALNARPRKRLGWRTPAETWNKHLQSSQQEPVATAS